MKKIKKTRVIALGSIAIYALVNCFLWGYNYPLQKYLAEEKFKLYLKLHECSFENVEAYTINKPYFFSGCEITVNYVEDNYEYQYQFYKDIEVNESTCIPKSCIVYNEQGFCLTQEQEAELKYPTRHKNSRTHSN